MNDRYSRQINLKYIGEAGQKRLARSRVVVIGQGALGTAISSYLVRAGVGNMLIVDDDIVELSNLQRQSLYNEADVGLKKADAALAHLQEINSEVQVSAADMRLNEENAKELLQGADVVMDATDNLETRRLINAVCVRKSIPWIYSGVAGSQAMTMNILPAGPCFNCLMPGGMPDGYAELTAATQGIFSTLAPLAASVACTECIKLLCHGAGSPCIRKTLLYMDIFTNDFQQIEITKLPGCNVCGENGANDGN